MKITALAFAAMACFAPATAAADTFVNLTPQPKEITVGTGELVLPASFVIADAGLDADMKAEVAKFSKTFSGATGISLSEGSTGLMTVKANSALADEGYTLTVTANGIAIEAATPAGLYYAFQTLMKVMPENVILGKYAAGTYALPLMTINDEPRYPWRGMEIDSARHFWSVDQLKKMIDIMAVYKLNRFHWHLTDDQGWRIEFPKYPKLTTEAASPLNCYWWDFDHHVSYLTNEMYGPYYYTVEEMKDIVAYAKERHIEVCPEIDLPGHMQCAIAAYPEFSTVPDASHPVRYWPGVSQDILDVSNPAVVQFCKDLIDHVADIFPYEYIHIGGDECPTNYWANSQACQDFKKEYGLSSDRAIQNWLVKELADHTRATHGRKLIAWNEIITTDGADKQLAKDADILIYCWLNAGAANNPSKQAADLGLRSVWCSTSHYYLDYPQWSGSGEPKSMGYALNLEHVYNATPDYEASRKELYYGVNCNLWTEYISEPKHLEYNALPRMIAVAETGWSPAAKKNFQDFKARFNADTKLLDLGNYNYGRHYVDAQNDDSKVMPAPGKFYRLITQASADANRRDRCIELVHSSCPLISSKSATVNRLWTNAQAAEGDDCYDWQYWTFEADPAGSGLYAMVNRKAPEGSVNPAMNGSSINARWDYDNSAKHYEFVIGDYYDSTTKGYTYSIRSNRGTDWYLNCAQTGANLTVNNWSKPDDGNGGIWLFALEGAEEATAAGEPFEPLTSGKYTIVNYTKRNTVMAVNDGELVTDPSVNYGAVAWNVTAGEYNADTNTQPVTLKNAATGLYIKGLAETALSTTAGIGFQDVFGDNGGYDVILTDNATEAAQVVLTKAEGKSFFLSLNGKRLFAFGANSTVEPNGVNARENAPVQQAAAWGLMPVTSEYNVTAKEGNNVIGSFQVTFWGTQALPELLALPPTDFYNDYRPESQTVDGSNVVINVKRIANTVVWTCRDEAGTIWHHVSQSVPVGSEATAPEFSYMTLLRVEEGNVAIYETEAYPGISKVSAPIGPDDLQDGVVYAIRDCHETRNAFRCATTAGTVNGAKSVDNGVSPMFTWTLEPNGTKKHNVRNLATDTYVLALGRSTTAKLGTKAYGFVFTYDTDHWNVRGSNGMYWDGDDALNLVGWDGGTGHPINIYTVEEAEPYFKLTVNEEDSEGNVTASRFVFVRAGAGYVFAPAMHPGKVITDVTGNEGLDEIYANKLITVKYAADPASINEIHVGGASLKGIYNLQGHRLDRISCPGIYIINGTKTLVK